MIGRRVGPYLIESELGSGAMGTVWAAVTRKPVEGLPRGTRVALKTVHPKLVRSEHALKRFEREARIGRMVQHPNVVRTFDSGTARTGLVGLGEPVPYIAMELVEGETLRDFLDSQGILSDALARHVGAAVARGLEAIHATGALHRDIKPQNVLITPDHVVKIMDLGIALPSDDDVQLTQAGAIVGSIPWMPPERLLDDDADKDDPRSDLYALGVVLWELLAGFHPFIGENRAVVMMNIMKGLTRRLGDVNPQVSALLEEAVHTSMAKEPDARFRDAALLAETLERGESGAWWQERAQEIRRRTRRPLRRPRIPRETDVHGREEELARLRELFDRAKNGDGGVVLIEGEAGVGKSRLVDELVRRLAAENQDLDFLFGAYPPGGAATIAGGVAQAFHEHLGEDGAGHLLSDLPLLVPAFDALLSGGLPPSGSVELNRESLQTCFAHALRALAETRPVILLIDDLHFAPAEGRSLFAALAMAVPGHRVLLVGNTRRRGADPLRATLTTLVRATHLELTRLDESDLVRMLEDCFDSADFASEVSGHVAAKSGGNPFFALEIVNSLRDGAFVTRDESGEWRRARALECMDVPSSVAELVQARLGELDDDDRALLDAASCCGYDFDGAVVADALGAAHIPTFQRLARLERQQRIVRASGRRFQFDHNQVQEVLYRALPEVLREQYHAALGEALEARAGATDKDPAELDGALAAELCAHFAAAGRVEPSLRYVMPAWEHLMSQVRHEEAVELLRRVLALAGSIPADLEVQLLLRLDRTLWRSGRLDEAVEATDRLVSLRRETGTPAQLAEALAASAARHQHRGEPDVVRAMFTEALSLVPDDDIPPRLTHAYCHLLLDLGEIDEGVARMRNELELAEADGDPARRRIAETTMGVLLRTAGAPTKEVRRHYRRSIQLAQETGDVASQIAPTINIGNTYQSDGHLDAAIDCFEKAAALAQRVGQRHGESVTGINLGSVYAVVGENDRARELTQRALELSRETGGRRIESYALQQLAELRWNDGDLAEAEHLARRAVEIRRRLSYVHLTASLLLLGTVLAEAGHDEEASTVLQESLELARERDHGRIAVMAASRLSRLLGGSPDAVREEFERYRDRIDGDDQVDIHIALWRATRAPADLTAAHQALITLRDTIPERYRESFVTNRREHRELAAAWAAHTSS